MCAMKIAMECPATGRRPDQDEIVDTFHSNTVSKQVVADHVDMVWAETAYGATTPLYFDYFATNPTNTAELSAFRNTRKLKHIMMDKKIWSS